MEFEVRGLVGKMSLEDFTFAATDVLSRLVSRLEGNLKDHPEDATSAGIVIDNNGTETSYTISYFNSSGERVGDTRTLTQSEIYSY